MDEVLCALGDAQATTTRPKITATADGERVVSHAGSRLLGYLIRRR